MAISFIKSKIPTTKLKIPPYSKALKDIQKKKTFFIFLRLKSMGGEITGLIFVKKTETIIYLVVDKR